MSLFKSILMFFSVSVLLKKFGYRTTSIHILLGQVSPELFTNRHWKEKKKSSSNPTVLSFPPFFFHISVMHFSSMFIHSSLSRVIQMISGSDEGDKAKASKVMLVHKRHDKIHTASMQKCGWRCGFLRVKSVCKSEIKGGFSQLNCEKYDTRE